MVGRAVRLAASCSQKKKNEVQLQQCVDGGFAWVQANRCATKSKKKKAPRVRTVKVCVCGAGKGKKKKRAMR
jgi:hypothetical protein